MRRHHMQIIPISELRNANKVSELCHSIGEPVYITKNGYGDMVLMGINAFEELTQQARSVKKSQNCRGSHPKHFLSNKQNISQIELICETI